MSTKGIVRTLTSLTKPKTIGSTTTASDVVREAVRRRDVRALCLALFGVRLTAGQVRIVRAVAFREHRRLVINAHTRYGKTWSVALGICLLILLDKAPLKIRLIAPTKDQASILRDYIADHIQRCRPLQDLLDLEATGVRRIGKEVSKKRFTFRDGKDLRILSAEGNAKRVMGFGGDVIVLDESVLLQSEAWAKIARMLAENREGMLVEMSNPWHTEGHYYRHWRSPRFHRIHIGWRQGVREGRITLEDVEEQREELSGIEFMVLWESRFPKASKDQLISHAWITRAQTTPLPTEVRAWTDRYSLDVASGGADKTVLTHTRHATLYGERGVFVDVVGQWTWDNADTMVTADMVSEHVPAGAQIVVDSTGVGKGVADRLRQMGYRVVMLQVGAAAANRKRFCNQKAELFWGTRTSFEKNLVRIPLRTRAPHLVRDLSTYRYRVKKGRVEVWEETTKSPDHGDSLAYGMHGRAKKRLTVGGTA